jgi:RNA-directed DNA polymerase
MVNTADPEAALSRAERRVLEIQTKLHRWATEEPGRRFCDLFNLVCDPAFLLVAWDRVRSNRGARSAGVDGWTAHAVRWTGREEAFLSCLREDLKAQQFAPRPVREAKIPKANGKLRSLGIPTVRDRVVQAALKLVLEPIFEADLRPCSYGFRPKRRAQDAIAEIHLLGTAGYEWVLEADIEACFDEIDHTALMERVRRRVGDKRVLALVKAFLKAGVMRTNGSEERSITGTPQGGILSPLLANIALSVLDEHFEDTWQASMAAPAQRKARHRKGLGTWRLIRYADDWVVMVFGTREHAEALREQAAAVLAPIGLRLSEAKTKVVHLDGGLDFLGWRIQRRRKRGSNRHYIYTYPSKKALASIVGKVRVLTRRSKHRHLSDLLHGLNPMLQGWCAYFRHGVSAATFRYLEEYAWRRVKRWIRQRHPSTSWATLQRRFLPRMRPTQNGITMFDPNTVAIIRYRYRGRQIPTPWTTQPATSD